MERRVRALTPDDIVNYPLKQAVRGYSVRQVDDLLDRVADEFERVHRELAETRQRLVQAEARAEALSEAESTLKRTLVTAQRAAEQTVAEARERAAKVVEQAQEEAERKHRATVSRAREELDELRRGQRELAARVDALREFESDYRSTLRSFVERHLRTLDELQQRVPPSLPEAEGAAAAEESQRAEEEPAGSAAEKLEESPPDRSAPDVGKTPSPETIEVSTGEQESARAPRPGRRGSRRQATPAQPSPPSSSFPTSERQQEAGAARGETPRLLPAVDLSRSEHLRWQVESAFDQVHLGSDDHGEARGEELAGSDTLVSDEDDRETVVIVHREPRRRTASAEDGHVDEGA